MSALLRAELLRLASRRLMVVLLICMAGLAALGAVVWADGARPVGEAERQAAIVSWTEERADWKQACLDETTDPPTDTCGNGWTVADNPEDYVRVPSSFGEYARGAIDLGFPLLLLGVAVLAASLVGSEFASGNIGTQLVFTPRRIPVMVAKVVATVLGGLVLAVAFLGTSLAFSAIMFLALRGAADMTAGVELPLTLGRAVVLGVLIAIMAGALAMATGSTLVTLGIFAVVFVGSFMTSSAIYGYAAVKSFLPDNLLFAMMFGRHEIYGADNNGSGEWRVMQVIDYDWALGCSVSATVLIVVICAWWFRRRDILR